MNFLNDCSEEVSEEKCAESSRKRTPADLSTLRNCTVLAMSNLLNANIDSGLMHSIGTNIYHLGNNVLISNYLKTMNILLCKHSLFTK